MTCTSCDKPLPEFFVDVFASTVRDEFLDGSGVKVFDKSRVFLKTREGLVLISEKLDHAVRSEAVSDFHVILEATDGWWGDFPTQVRVHNIKRR